MQRLHEAAGLGRFGVLTAVQGMGGVGKTALAIQYAYTYADFYPGGRWLVGCAGETSLASALRRLDLDLGITLNEAEKRDDTLAARRVLAELERRTIEGAKARSGEKDPPQPKALLLLDNVDQPALLQPPQSDLLTGRQWLHVLATTRSGAEDFGNDPESLMVLSIDELPEDDALRLIESYQPGGRFPTAQEREAALELVKLLGGFTLAVEVVAVHLGERAGRMTCAAFLQRMKKEGLAGLDSAALATKRGIKHGEKLIGATLKPTLDLLSEPEHLVLGYAALLPPDTIPLPWLRALAAQDFPDLGQDADICYDDPWLSLVNHLLGLRLLQVVDLAVDGRTPRLLRMHRLVGELVQRQIGGRAKEMYAKLASHAFPRSEYLETNWHKPECRWEISPLLGFTNQLLDIADNEATRLVKWICQWLSKIETPTVAEAIIRRGLKQQEANPNTDPTELAITYNNLGRVLTEQSKFSEAEPLLRKALDIDERQREPNHPFIAIRLHNLASVLLATERLTEAEVLIRRALEISERNYGENHPSVAASLNDLGFLLCRLNRPTEAEPLIMRSLAIDEQSLGPDHPSVALRLYNLARVLESTNRKIEAESLFRRAIAIAERSIGLDHPLAVIHLSGLGVFLAETNRAAEAEPLLRQALAVRQKYLPPDHPDTIKSISQLAVLLHNRSNYAEAEQFYRSALEARERVLGPEHPDTLGSMASLAILFKDQKDYARAEPLYRRALEIRQRVLGL